MKKLFASFILMSAMVSCSDKIDNDLVTADNSGFYQWKTEFKAEITEGEETKTVSTGSIPTTELNILPNGDAEVKFYEYQLHYDLDDNLIIENDQIQYDLFVAETRTGDVVQSLLGEFSVNYTTSCEAGKDTVDTPNIKTYFVRDFGPVKAEGGFTKRTCSDLIPKAE
ncbi:hypothetical protein [Flammeovirga sp. EKP202]|uniref:hypothetical protein n=1 Tax=Flammeovirga sp. EKP202 TaxID=2770592 RepID=UPI00165EC31B|nr:hypothetical protein [Flammeovirga sp. EKP202]MBD0403338.1 hypothetical protein [Flammeovirga sp. EKP202]